MVEIDYFKENDIEEISNLVKGTINKCNRQKGSEKGVDGCLNWWTYENNSNEIKECFRKTKFCFVAKEDNEILGMIRGNLGEIKNFFVNPDYQGKSIGKLLLGKYEKEQLDNGVRRIDIESTLFAVPMYEKMGYKKKGDSIFVENLELQPMYKDFL